MSISSKRVLYPKKPVIILGYRNPVAIIQHQLEYWFSKYSNGFFKFIEPCKHAQYRVGDSWTEEIGYSRPVFNKAFDTIGIRYKSKSEFLKAEDKFQGKLYASYHDRKTNKTFFVRNSNFTKKNETLENSSKINTKPQVTKDASKIITTAQNHKIKDQEKRGDLTSNNRSRNETNNHSYGGTIGGKNKNSFTVITSSSLEPKAEVQKTKVYPEAKKISEEMKNIWIEEIGWLEVSYLSQTLVSRMNKAYQETFKNSLDQWRQYCRQIASSKFLMGEKKNTDFKAKLLWVVKPETYERIQAGDFTLGDREVVLSKDQQQKEAERVIQETKEEFLELPRHPYWIKACLLLTERVGGFAAKALKELDLSYFGNNASEESIAELKASSRFHRDYVQRSFKGEILRALEEITGAKINYLSFTV